MKNSLKFSKRFHTKFASHFSSGDMVEFRPSRSSEDWAIGKVKKFDREAREYLVETINGKEKWIVDDSDYIRKHLFQPEIAGREAAFQEFLSESDGLSEEEAREIFNDVFDQEEQGEMDEWEKEIFNLTPLRRSASSEELEDYEFPEQDPWEHESFNDKELDELRDFYQALLSKKSREKKSSFKNKFVKKAEDTIEESSEDDRREKLRQLMTEYQGLQSSVYQEEESFDNLLKDFSRRIGENPSEEIDDFEDENMAD